MLCIVKYLTNDLTVRYLAHHEHDVSSGKVRQGRFDS